MSIIQKGVCIECGKLFEYEKQNYSGQYRYCSKRCNKARYKRDYSNKVKCRHCGNVFVSRGENQRVCCSRACAIADIREQAAVWQVADHSVEFRNRVVALCLGGYRRADVVAALGLSCSAAKNWLAYYRDHGNTYKTKQRYAYRSAQSSAEWLGMLRADITNEANSVNPETENRRIFVVCGTVKWKRSSDQLSAIVEGRLGMNPYDGSVYVFCGNKLDMINYIYWDGTGFSVIARRCEWGTYPWPAPQIGAVVPVTPQELGFILSGRSKKPDKP